MNSFDNKIFIIDVKVNGLKINLKIGVSIQCFRQSPEQVHLLHITLWRRMFQMKTTVDVYFQCSAVLCLMDWVSSQLVTWPTRNLVNPYPGSPLVTTFEKSTRNQSLGYELTCQKLLTKTRTQTYSLSRYLWLYLYFILYTATSIWFSYYVLNVQLDGQKM